MAYDRAAAGQPSLAIRFCSLAHTLTSACWSVRARVPLATSSAGRHKFHTASIRRDNYVMEELAGRTSGRLMIGGQAFKREDLVLVSLLIPSLQSSREGI